ncbi:MAG: dTDP-4-dehydrorhamnose reductase [Deltaproteobacteria bacterium]|nr:dTDP-4-dehydrorhamnose reductase [Deltaproteobacteria bacterium]
MTEVLVIGGKGQLGTDLLRALAARGTEAVGLDLPDIDVGDAARTRAQLLELRPAVVINTAAYHLVDLCEDHAAEAFAINAEAPRQLAKVCRELDAVFMHFSTDFVFGGAPCGRPWTEGDRPEPQSVYATSKLAGEHLVRESHDKHFVIRTCGLYGSAGRRPQGGSFVEIMIRAAEAKKKLTVVNDQTVAPTSTFELAAALLALIETRAYGLYHVTNSGECTWFEFAREIFRLTGMTPDLRPVTSAEYGSKAKRPRYSILDNAKLVAAGVPALGSWQQALAAYVARRGQEVRA